MDKKNKVIAKWYTGHFQHFPYNYEQNWNALMPVIDKIESMEYGVLILKNKCEIEYTPDRAPDVEVCSITADTKIQAVHESVYQFILQDNE